MNTPYKVYIHIFPNDKVYIGITREKTSQRWRYGRGYKGQPLMWRAIQKYGWDNIKHEILYDNLTAEEAKAKEIELIEQYNSNNEEHGYNITIGGDGVHGYHHNEERRKKITQLSKGRKHTEETKRIISEKLKGHRVSKENIERLKKMTQELKAKGIYKTHHRISEQGKLAHKEKLSCAIIQFNESKEPIGIWQSNSLIKKCYHNLNIFYALENFNLKAGGYYWKRCKDIELEECISIVLNAIKLHTYKYEKGVMVNV